jgi:periplasmic divalent cation tolerance protein
MKEEGAAMEKVLLMISTAKSMREGKKIAAALVENGLVACVNVVPGVNSFFLWEGKRCLEKEVILFGKTTQAQKVSIINKINEIHSYELPEILFLNVGGGEKKYLEWVRRTAAKKPKKNY